VKNDWNPRRVPRTQRCGNKMINPWNGPEDDDEEDEWDKEFEDDEEDW
jgi:hypothetical protein